METASAKQAFPRQGVPGMTLRDYFAAAALPVLVYVAEDESVKDPARISFILPAQVALEAYAYADAMLEERGK